MYMKQSKVEEIITACEQNAKKRTQRQWLKRDNNVCIS